MNRRLAATAIGGVATLVLLGALVRGQPAPGAVPAAARADYAAVAARLEPFIAHEMEDKEIPGLSIALVEDQEVVWARGFGYADPDAKLPATAETVHRVGSVSKLFTDIAMMRLAEQGKIDVDAPITDYLPDFRPKNPYRKPITLRMLTSHRAGLIREPPVGNYFETTEPSLAATIASLNATALVYEPGTKTKYSNAGIATVGYVLERTQDEAFASWLKGTVLLPMGLTRSSFLPQPDLVKDLAKAYMWTYDGRLFEAPRFQLGMAPAGSMYSTVLDLGRFLSVLFARGRTRDGVQVLKPETIEVMWTPQFAPSGTKRGFGIGFAVSDLDGRRIVGHDGAIYGFATTLMALPDDRLGVVAVATKDCANPVVDRIAHAALRMMRAKQAGRPLPEPEVTAPLDRATARRLAGRYASGDRILELLERKGELYMTVHDGASRGAGEPPQHKRGGGFTPPPGDDGGSGGAGEPPQHKRGGGFTPPPGDDGGSGGAGEPPQHKRGGGFTPPPRYDQRLRLRVLGGDGFVVDGANGYGLKVQATPERVTVGGETFSRVAAPPPPAVPESWTGLIGEYGWDHNTLFVYEHEGRLHVLIEWFTAYPLEEGGLRGPESPPGGAADSLRRPVTKDSFRFPDWGLYAGEPVVFSRDGSGRATEVNAANVVFKRRGGGPEGNATFRIRPVRPVPELRKEALLARPPVEKGEFRAPDLVEPTRLDPTIKLDIRYASTENFLSTPVYTEARAFLQRPAALALVRAHRKLAEKGYGLLVHDGYRPWYVTKVFWDATPPEGKVFVADPSDGSRHNRGCAVDLTLYERASGQPVEMPGVYDEQSPRSFPDYPGGTTKQRRLRETLRWAMEEEGFEVYDFEWWHFDYKDWRSYPVLNVTFDRIAPGPAVP